MKWENKTWLTRLTLIFDSPVTLCCVVSMLFHSATFYYMWPVVYTVTFIKLCRWNNNYAEIFSSCADMLWTHISYKAKEFLRLWVWLILRKARCFFPSRSTKKQPHKLQFLNIIKWRNNVILSCVSFLQHMFHSYTLLIKYGVLYKQGKGLTLLAPVSYD